jgi:adenylate cyclase
LLACGVAAGLARLKQEQAALAARVRFEQFFSPELSQQLEADPTMLEGRDAEVTLLFGDIVGFSRISERMGPKATVAWINSVMDTMSDFVMEEAGVLVDYTGDELFAMWGAPTPCEDHAARACRTALAMQRGLVQVNQRWEEQVGEPTTIGIGVNTGIARVGNVGSRRRFKYGPLGNDVNLASRVQGATKYLRSPLLIAATTAEKLGDEFSIRRLCKVKVVNIQQPIDIYEIVDQPDDEWEQLREQYEQALDSFEEADFSSAAQTLGALALNYPNDGPSVLLLSRVVNSLMSDSEDDFSPVWELGGK